MDDEHTNPKEADAAARKQPSHEDEREQQLFLHHVALRRGSDGQVRPTLIVGLVPRPR